MSLGAVCAIAGCCAAASAVGTGIFRRWAFRRRLLDIPNERSSHHVPTPRGAGIVIGAVMVVAMLGGVASGAIAVSAEAVLVALAAAIVAAVSAADDVRGLSTTLRLAVHVTCAAAVVIALPIRLWSLEGILSVLWIVGLTNAYNFMDGIDGIAGAQAIIAAATLTATAVAIASTGLTILGAAITGASVGFLLHNWPPARVFMGDVGSALLGFTLAAAALDVWVAAGTRALPLVASLWPFVFDTSLTLARRILRGENLFQAHRSHLYQRLVAAGRSHASVTLGYAAGAALGSLAAFASVAAGRHLSWVALPVAAGVLVAAVSWTERVWARRTMSG